MSIPAFENDSIFLGWFEYFDDQGVSWRREDKDFHYNFFKKSGNAYLFEGSLRKRRLKGIRAIHDTFINLQNSSSDTEE